MSKNQLCGEINFAMGEALWQWQSITLQISLDFLTGGSQSHNS